MMNFTQALNANAYPGRGILIGKNTAGTHAVIVYFIMGRSVNSRNRVFEETADGIRTRAFDESKLTDPSLIIYHPVRVTGDTTIVTNGDQTDTIRDALAAGGDFASALRTREFEPDGPNWTPRISGTVRICGGGMFTKMSILKAGDAEGTFCNRYTYEYPDCPAGTGRFIHTYQGDGDPLPSFSGEPEALAIEGDPDELAKSVWNALNEENKVSLFVQFIDLASGKADTRIINKNV